jgi:hypothetical protein
VIDGLSLSWLHDLWQAAKEASPFAAMFSVVMWIVRSADARKERRERREVQLRLEALQDRYTADVKEILVKTQDGLSAAAVGMNGTSAGQNAVMTALTSIRDMLLSGNVGTVREVLDRIEAKGVRKPAA